MSWSVAIERSQKKPGSSRLFEPVSQSQKTADMGCSMRRLGYGVFATDIARDAENASKRAIRASVLISSGPDRL
jgi:hypothetical protein